MNFKDFGFSPELMESLDAMGFEKATPVQEKSIPPVMEGKDMIACAQTGTGKTAAYLLPVMNKIFTAQMKGTNALILAPTRELAVQIDQQFQGMAYFLNLHSIPVYGGRDSADWEIEKKALTSGADVIIATPGRLIAHLNLGYVKFDSLHFLVLDEADRMLDMGFHEDIMKIYKHLPAKKQTLMFSATMPSKIRQLANKMMQNPAQVDIAVSAPAAGVKQQAYLVHSPQKIDLLTQILKEKDYDSVVIFASRKATVKDLTRSMKKAGFGVEGISSDLEQKQREEILLDFRNKKLKIIVATDVLSRGIDIDDINMVLNFDVPGDAEDYVHRVGRTARAARTGEAITFINGDDVYRFQKIERLIKQTVEKLPLPEGMGEGPAYTDTGRKPNRGGGKYRGKGPNRNRKGGGKPFHKKRRNGGGDKPKPTN